MRSIVVAVACLSVLTLAPAAQGASDAARGELVVRFESGVSEAQRADARGDADVSLERPSKVPGLQLVKVEPGQSLSGADRRLEVDPRVAYAEPNELVRPASTPNDPLFGSLWGLHNTGQSIGGTTGTADSDIDAPEAWDITRGSASVTVAIADTGIAYDHPDLSSRAWQNAAEAGGAAGKDDDGNGYVDDVRGWDTIDRDRDPRDYEDHGTHVAGTVGAAGDNGVGITGVAQDVRLMPVRVLRPGGGTTLSVAEGFDYAAKTGADVVNASLSGGGTSQTVRDVVAAHPGTLFVVAAGNDGKDIDASSADTQFPCNITEANLLCVAATDHNDARAGFSNYGTTSVDLAAPGVAVRSSVPVFDLLPGSADGFETSDFTTRWVASGTWARTSERRDTGTWSAADSPGATYANNSDTSLRSAAPYDLTARRGCFADFRMRLQLAGGDSLRVETSPDGTSWTEQERFSGSTPDGAFGSYAVGFDGLSGPAYLRFRLVSDASGTSDGVHVDNVRVLCAGSSYPDETYEHWAGTSMATPHVSGVAALLKALRPEASVPDLRADLLQGGDPISGLTGTVTNRRLNARGALVHGGPLATTGPAASVGTRGASLVGAVNPVAAETSYHFEYGLDQSYGSRTSSASAGAGVAATPVSASVSGLEPSTTYHYRLVATRDGIERAGQDQVFTTTSESAPPGEVTGLEALAGVRSIGLSWPAAQNADLYFVHRRDATGVYPATALASTTARSHLDSGLSAGARYCYRVQAGNVWGLGALSEEVCAAAGSPSPPPPTPAPTSAPKPPAGSVVLVDLSRARRSIRASRRGVFAFAFRATPGLAGGATFATAGRVRLTRGSRARVVTLGSKKFRTGRDGSARVAVRLGRSGLALLRRSRTLRIKAKITASGRTSTRTFLLRAARGR